VMQTRWAMSFLRGPLTRDQISSLMNGRKAEITTDVSGSDAPLSPVVDSQHVSQPVLSGNIEQGFWPVDGKLDEACQLEYRPALLGEGKLHFVDREADADHWQDLVIVQPIHGELADPIWNAALTFEIKPLLDKKADTAGRFADLPSPFSQEKNYRGWGRDLKDWLYQTQRDVRWRHDATGSSSHGNETEEDFRGRIIPSARLAEEDRIKREFDGQIQKAKDALAKAETQASRHRWWWLGGIGNTLWRAFEIIVTRLLGARSRKQLVTTASTNQMYRGRRQYADAQEDLTQLSEELAQLEQERERQLAELTTKFRPGAIALEKIEISPRKSDIDVGRVMLVWLPWQIDANGRAQPIY
jgi:hypothetical protein